MYALLKTIHLLAVVIFLGNVITGLFWKRHADRSRNRAIVAHTIDGLIRADRWFTIPGVVVITTAGILAAVQGRIPLIRTGWVFWSIVAFSLSGIAFVWRVAPLQVELLRIARDGSDDSFDWDLYHRTSVRWELWAAVATITPLVALVLMVWKPAL